MKVEMDKIIFESSREIDIIINALGKSTEKDNEVVKDLVDKLEVMYMTW